MDRIDAYVTVACATLVALTVVALIWFAVGVANKNNEKDRVNKQQCVESGQSVVVVTDGWNCLPILKS